jgi:putative membrane protein
MQRIVNSSILLSFAILIILKIENAQASLYIHPRFMLTARFAYVVLIVLALVEIVKPRSGEDSAVKLKPATIAVFLLPLILGFSTPTTALDSDMVRKKGGLSNQTTKKETPKETASKNFSKNENTPKDKNDKANTKVANAKKDGVVEIDDENFVETVDDINENYAKKKGKIIKIRGFVYKDPEFKPEEFVLARFLIVCCAADASPYGLLFDYPKASTLKEDDWYEVKAQVTDKTKKLTGIDVDFPVMQVLKIEKIKAPQNQYVYGY